MPPAPSLFLSPDVIHMIKFPQAFHIVGSRMYQRSHLSWYSCPSHSQRSHLSWYSCSSHLRIWYASHNKTTTLLIMIQLIELPSFVRSRTFLMSEHSVWLVRNLALFSGSPFTPMKNKNARNYLSSLVCTWPIPTIFLSPYPNVQLYFQAFL